MVGAAHIAFSMLQSIVDGAAITFVGIYNRYFVELDTACSDS
jgi:hypothetical protein